MKFGALFLAIGLGLMYAPLFAGAAGDDFTISATLIGGDTTAPTTPTLLSVVPVAPTQINVTWQAATDDVQVAGYRLFRDSVQIATTTLLAFSDAGLTPSTTYAYTVDAFDFSGNISSSSLAIATTTFAVPLIATSTGTSRSNSGTRTGVGLVGLDIVTTKRTATFIWETTVMTQYMLVWGRTTAYELGSVSGITYTQNHLTSIDALEPGTTYFYELQATNARGVTTVLSADTFTTERSIVTQTLPNVQGFVATVSDTDVELSWRSNFLEPNLYVRVVRSHLFYPSNIQDGAVVYEGTGESFLDRGALDVRSPQYYTIFVRTREGGVSSGAIARAFKITDSPGGQGTSTEPTSTIPPDIGDDTILRALDITIVQGENEQLFDEEITLDKDVSFLISIPYGAVAKNLKSIIVSIQNPTNQRELSAYLLKLNQTGDAYTARVPAPSVSGTAGIMVEVFDYEQATVRRISSTISFVDTSTALPFFPDRLLMYLTYLFIVGSLLWCLIFLLLWWRRRREKLLPEDNNDTGATLNRV